jgi:hypothetical protein
MGLFDGLFGRKRQGTPPERVSESGVEEAMNLQPIDPRARQILFDAYWSAKGWKVPRDEPSASDFSSTNFARLKWGAVPRFFPVCHAFMLERFEIEPRPSASDGDRAVMHALLTAADSMPPDVRARDLEQAWRPLIRSSRQERDELIEILIACGVLTPSRRTSEDHERIPLRSNWTDEAALWRGDDGVNRDQASSVFGWG